SPFFGQDDYWRSVADALLHAFPGLSTRRSTGLGISHQTRHIANVTDNHSGLAIAFFCRLRPFGCTLCGVGVVVTSVLLADGSREEQDRGEDENATRFHSNLLLINLRFAFSNDRHSHRLRPVHADATNSMVGSLGPSTTRKNGDEKQFSTGA